MYTTWPSAGSPASKGLEIFWKMQNKFHNVDYISHTSKINHHTYVMEQ